MRYGVGIPVLGKSFSQYRGSTRLNSEPFLNRRGLSTLSTLQDHDRFSGATTVQKGVAQYKKLKITSHMAVAAITPDDVGMNVQAVCNPGATENPEGGVDLLARVILGHDYPRKPFASHLYLIHSDDGIVFDKPHPLIQSTPEFDYGFEDPRISKIGRDYYIVATGYDGNMPHICLFKTRDLKSPLTGPILIGPDGVDDKDAFFLPEKVRVGSKEKFMFFHRVGETGNIQYLLLDSIDQLQSRDFWKEQLSPENLKKHTLLAHRENPYQTDWQLKLGGGPPPIKTKDGWIFLYHASDATGVYRMGIALLDLKQPWKVIARSPDFIMEPTKGFETTGKVPNVVFPQGVVTMPDPAAPDNPDLYIYYGAADKHVGLAKVKINTLLDYVKQFDAKGRPVPPSAEAS